MPWTNPLDRLPQIPADWANHIVWGGILGLGLFALGTHAPAVLGWARVKTPAELAATYTLAVAVIKKTFDYVLAHEPADVCFWKALVTAAWPASLMWVA